MLDMLTTVLVAGFASSILMCRGLVMLGTRMMRVQSGKLRGTGRTATALRLHDD
jgi:hypothetical protein